MNILHITDFHFKSINTLQKNVVFSIIEAIKKKNIIIDFVFFTGDLVNTGDKIENFNTAKEILFDRLTTELHIDKCNIIFCAGNHDINRQSVHSAIKPFMNENINSNEHLNNFYEKKEDVFRDSLKPSTIFNSFLKSVHDNDNENIIKDLYSIHFRNYSGKKIGIVCLNTAWLSAIDKDKSGKYDKENLLIPLSLLEEIKKNLGTVEKRIVLLHHPLYFLKEFNFYQVEKFIHNEFDLMLSGHVHKISSSSIFSGSNGIFTHVSKSSLSSDEGLGCSILSLEDLDCNQIVVEEFAYIKDTNSCISSEKIIHTLPCGEEKAEQIKFRSKIYDKIEIEKTNSNSLLLLNDNKSKDDFISLFNQPVLKTESEGSLETKNLPTIVLEELISSNKNYLIFGKDKCGKTSLLRRIQLECLMKFSKINKIPFYLDLKEIEHQLDDKFTIEKLIINYFGINRSKLDQILSSGNFLLLVDNYDSTSATSNVLISFFENYSKVSYILCMEFNVTKTVEIYSFGKTTYEKLYFHDLRRKEIITYSEKRLNSNQNKDEIQDKIMSLCKQLELPLNYWTISLLLLIYNKSTDNYYKNLFEVLDICVDEILNKKYLLISRSRISFDQLKKICGDLAKYLFDNHKNTIYSTTAINIINCIEKTLLENERITLRSNEIFDYLISSSILKIKDNNNYVFRLNGFFEYFLAYQMTKDQTFKAEILEDDIKFLAFKNQLEIYSGFIRDDIGFLTSIFLKTKKKLDSIFIIYNKNKDVELLNKIKQPSYIENFAKKISIDKALSKIEKAEIMQDLDEFQVNSEVHIILEFDPNNINSELIERYLSILSRVYKNSDEISGSRDLINQIFNYLLEAYCDFGFFIIDELSGSTKKELVKENYKLDESQELILLKFISDYVPLICQTCFYDGIGHFTFERLIKDKITELEIDAINNQYKLFMLYFLLIDIDLKANKDFIENALDNIKIAILKSAIVFKLNYYMAFKCENNNNLQQFISQKIQKAKISLNPKTNSGEINKQISDNKKISLVNKEIRKN